MPNTRCPDTRVEPLVKASLVNSVKNVPVVGELEIYENKSLFFVYDPIK